MKTKKQLEKEIEGLNNETDVCEKCILLRAKKLNNFCAIHDISVAEVEATLIQTNEIIEMIKEHRNIGQYKHPDSKMIIAICNELITKIKGDENGNL